MSITVEAVSVIDAEPREVWDVLTDFDRYPEWSSHLLIAGEARVGARLTVRLGGAGGMAIHPKVLVATPEVEFQWLGRLGLPGIVDGAHHFRLARRADGTTEFRHGEVYSGVVVSALRPLMRDAENPAAYASFNAALKRRVESMRRG